MITVVVVLLVVLALLSSSRVPLEFTALAAVALLALTGALPAQEAFAGFVDPAVVFTFSLLAMGQGLMATGVARPLGLLLDFAATRGETTFLLVTMAVVGGISSVVSNTATTAAFLPITSAAALRSGLAPGRVLLPLAYASMLGGTLFLPGTSTNIVVSSQMNSWGYSPLSFAELTPLSLPLALLGLATIAVLAPRLLPRAPGSVRLFRADALVERGSRFVGGPASVLAREVGVRVLGVVTEGGLAEPDRKLSPGDHVIVEAPRERLAALQSAPGLHLRTPDPVGEGPSRIAEFSVPPGSPLDGRSLREMLLLERFGVVALALHRGPAFTAPRRRVAHKLASERLAAGDVLLLQGPADRLRLLSARRILVALDEVELVPVQARRALAAVLIFGGSLLVAGLDLLPMSVAGATGLLAMVVTGVMPMRLAWRVDWRVLALIGAMIAVGRAVEQSGLADALGRVAVAWAAGGGPRLVMVALMAATVLLSAPMSNQGAALVMLPVALRTAAQLGVDPRPFAIAITLAASLSFVTPLEPSCVMVFRPGRYTFGDFVRVGTPLTLVLLVLLALGIPEFWPF